MEINKQQLNGMASSKGLFLHAR